MKAPHYERMALLGVAIRTATEELNAPIDRVEVLDKHIQCWAGSKVVTLSYDYAESGALDEHGNFIVHVGSGSWEVAVVRNPTPRRPTLIGRALAKLMK
jgi:hypothetical protein